jgi:hypothetical protein
MAIQSIVERLQSAYSPSLFSVVAEGKSYRVKFQGIDFSDSSSRNHREFVKNVLSMDYKVEDDFTDFVISEI